MKRALYLLTTFTLACSTYLQAARSCHTEGELAVGYSYRQDSLSYENKDVNGIITTQKFDNIKIHQITARGFFSLGDFYFRGQADSGWIFGGATQKKEAAGSINIFEQKGDVDDCIVFDVSGGVGCMFDCTGSGFKFIPMFGYSWSRQDLETSSLKVVNDFINDLDIDTKIVDFKECYRLDWYGPWIGVDLIYDVYCGWRLYGAFEYHWADINNRFKTNNVVVEDIPFEQLKRNEDGCGQGFVGTLGASFDICCDWTLFLMGTYQSWNLWHGCGKDQDGDLFEMTKLDWKTWQATIGIACAF